MNELTIFLTTYGWQLALIALLGIILLGVLKYANVFSNIEKEKRKPIYFSISVGFSVGATVIYLLVIDKLTWSYLVAISGAIYALNQTMYAIYETTNLRDLLKKIAEFIKEKFNK